MDGWRHRKAGGAHNPRVLTFHLHLISFFSSRDVFCPTSDRIFDNISPPPSPSCINITNCGGEVANTYMLSIHKLGGAWMLLDVYTIHYLFVWTDHPFLFSFFFSLSFSSFKLRRGTAFSILHV